MNDYIVEEIKKYMNNPLKYAILLSGEWGSGKTYFVKNELSSIPIIYISLNGVANLNEVSFQLTYKLLNKKCFGKKTENEKVNGVVTTVGDLLVTHIESKINFSFSKLIKDLKGINLNNKLIVFDDLERCRIPLEEILGFINTLVEHNSVKVLIVANETELENKDHEYSKIKEKLIYETLKFIPDIDKIYDKLILEDRKEICENKIFFIDELKKYNHLNVRTIQFVFQRYKELCILIDQILKFQSIDDKIIDSIYKDIFKYIIVIARDYKMGNNIENFKEDSEISYYQLTENSYFAITSFKFVNDFIRGNRVEKERIEEVLKNYIGEIQSNINNENSTLNIINRWWELEDDQIENCNNQLLNELEKNIYPFDTYPKILIYMIRIVKIDFPEEVLNNALKFMKQNIEKATEYVSLGYKMLDTVLNKEEIQKYTDLKNELLECIELHNSAINKNGILDMKSKHNGEKGMHIYRWCIDHKTDFSIKKKFLNEVGIENIVYVIQSGNVFDVRCLIYLFNEIYNYSNVKELYPYDLKDLKKLLEKLQKIDKTSFNKMKNFSFNSFVEDIQEIIEKLD